MKSFDKKHWGIFAGGIAFGTAGIRLLTSDDAKKVYTGCTAAGLRVKDFVMNVVGTVKENCDDIVAEAKQINEERNAEETVIEAVEDVAEAVTEA